MPKSTGCDPRVVLGNRHTESLSFSHQLTIANCYPMVVSNNHKVTENHLKVSSLLLTPIRVLSTEVKFTNGYERDCKQVSGDVGPVGLSEWVILHQI